MPTVQALNAGQTLTDSFTVADRRRHRAGRDHHHQRRQRCGGDHRHHTGTVTEAGGVDNGTPGIPTATGNLNATDVDNPADPGGGQRAGASANGYGSYTLSAAGVWTYTLDNSNATVQALNVGQTLTDTFTSPRSTAPPSWSPSPSTAPTTPP